MHAAASWYIPTASHRYFLHPLVYKHLLTIDHLSILTCHRSEVSFNIVFCFSVKATLEIYIINLEETCFSFMVHHIAKIFPSLVLFFCLPSLGKLYGNCISTAARGPGLRS